MIQIWALEGDETKPNPFVPHAIGFSTPEEVAAFKRGVEMALAGRIIGGETFDLLDQAKAKSEQLNSPNYE